jgi:hypothetical protein
MCKSILSHVRSIKPCKTMLCCVKLVSETNTLKWFYTTMEECLISIFGGWSGGSSSKFQNYFGDGWEWEGCPKFQNYFANGSIKWPIVRKTVTNK